MFYFDQVMGMIMIGLGQLGVKSIQLIFEYGIDVNLGPYVGGGMEVKARIYTTLEITCGFRRE